MIPVAPCPCAAKIASLVTSERGDPRGEVISHAEMLVLCPLCEREHRVRFAIRVRFPLLIRIERRVARWVAGLLGLPL